MTLKMSLRWKNPDASSDINLRFKDVIAKGFLPEAPSVPFAPPALGAELVPVPFVLQVSVSPFVLVNYDGAVVVSDTAITPTPNVTDGQINYVVVRARYRLMDSPIIQVQVLTQAAYLADPELPWLHVAGVVDLSSGGPYATVPLSRIFYEARDAIDEQTRSSWREPVATSGLLPIGPADHNRQGDVRLVTDTGSFYWWNEVAGLWEVFDEVPVIVHRDYEHTNGITGDSAAGTLLPGVTGAGALSELTVAAVAAGSAYTVNGRLLQSPGAPFSTLASGVGASRGLIRLEIDDVGVLTPSYRAFSGTSNVDFARIVNMSDAHPAGPFSLIFTFIGSTLTWDSGPPVVVVVAPSGARRYRLYRPNGVDWIEIQVLTTPAAPGFNISDNYTVNTPTDFETRFLVGYWFWDGSGVKPLIVGQDKRRFGNLAFPQMATEFKDTQFYPPETELRGNMVYSGGTCTSLAGLNLQILGPIVSYIRGKRFETPAFFNGTTLLNNQPNIYIYVDEQGVLQISITNPATVFDAAGRPLQFATVARVTTAGGFITVVDDERDPQLIVGAASRNVRVKLTPTGQLRYVAVDKDLRLEDSGSLVGTVLSAGGAVFEDGYVDISSGVGGQVVGANVNLDLNLGIVDGNQTDLFVCDPAGFKFDDANTPGPQYMTAVGEANLTVLQPGNATPSVFGTLRDLQRAKKFNLGVETGCVPVGGALASVNIGPGTFYDALGRRIGLVPVATNVLISGAVGFNVYAIVWDPDLTATGSFKSVNLTAGSGCEIQDLPFAVVVLNGVGNAVALLEDVRRFADGQYDRSFVTVGPTQGFQDAAFASLRKALLHIMSFGDSEPAPTVIRLIGNITEPVTVAENAGMTFTNANGFPWAQPERLSNVRVVGVANTSSTTTNHGRPTITWTSTSGPLIDFNLYTLSLSSLEVKGFGFQNVNFSASGTASITDHRRCLFRNAGLGFQVFDASIDGNNLLSHLLAWTDLIVDLGGSPGSATTQVGTLFQRVFGTQCVDSGGDALFYFGDATGTNNALVTDINGRLSFLDCVFECDATDLADFFLWTATEVSTNTVDFDIVVDKTTIRRHQSIFNNADLAGKLLISSSLLDISLGIASNVTRAPELIGCVFGGTSVNLSLAGDVIGCVLNSGCTLTLEATNRISNCNFEQGTVTGVVGKLSNSTVNLGITGVLTAVAAPTSTVESTITDCVIQKANDSLNSNTMLRLTGAISRCSVANTVFVYTNTAITSSQAVIAVTGSSASLSLRGCVVVVPAGTRDNMTAAVTVTSFAAFYLSIEGCKFNVQGSFFSVSRSAGSATGEIHINSNTVSSSGTVPIDVANSTSGQMTMMECNDNNFAFTALDPFINIFGVRDLFVSGNDFRHTNGGATYTFGAITATEGRQDTLVVRGNIFRGDNVAAAKCDVTGDSYKSVRYENNSQAVTSVSAGASPATAYLQISGDSVFSNDCTVSGNQFTVDSDAVAGSIAESLILVTGFKDINCNGNTQYVGSLGGDISAYILLLNVSHAASCQGNTLLSVQNTGATTGTTSAFIAVAGTAAGVATMAVANNAMEASVGGSGTGPVQCLIQSTNAITSSVSGNALRGRGGGTIDVQIVGADVTGGISITGNGLRSSGDSLISIEKTCEFGSVTGNTMDANAGSCEIRNWSSQHAVVNSNNIFASTSVTIASGDILSGAPTTSSGAAMGSNTVSCNGTVQMRANAAQTATATGNSVRGGASTVDISTNLNGTNGASAVVGNSASTTATGATIVMACYTASGSDHMCQISDNVYNSTGTAQAIIGSSATRGAVKDNLSHGALVIANSALTTYSGGNNANT